MEVFHSPYSHGFIRVAVGVPIVAVANPHDNVHHTLELAGRASELHAAVALFPEMGLSGYANEDLFHQDALLDATLDAVSEVIEASRGLCPILIVGAPLRFEHKLFNCAVVIYRGQILGITPKTYLPNYREFYEKRQFSSARDAIGREVTLLGQRAPLGNDLLYEVSSIKHFVLHVEICEDLWTPIPPSTYAALAGATILSNLSASNITIGKADYRRELCASQSAKCIAAYLYAAAGPGESTTDLSWDGHAMIYENDERLAESQRFSSEGQVITADVDLDRLIQERMRMTSFNDAVADHRERIRALRRIPVHFEMPSGRLPLKRTIERFPYVPSDPTKRDERCSEAYNIQVHGLMKRLMATGIQKIVIGVSGGLDSTHALIVCAQTLDRLKLPRSHLLAYMLPGFATSEKTHTNALELMRALEVAVGEIDIKPSCLQMLKDIGHPYAQGQPIFDVTFENVQAGERTSHLFRLANYHKGLVVGTGDLSELALGWCTYGVGDQMSHYNVNASIPKTLIQYLIRWVSRSGQFKPEVNTILQAVLETEISPELVPSSEKNTTEFLQSTQGVIGPYELQDFYLYYVSRFGFRPSKVAFLAQSAWGDKRLGSWLEDLPESNRHEYDLATIKKWLEVFLVRFIQLSQFKRSCLPNATKVGSGGSLSPRSDWRAPSDAEVAAWLQELRNHVLDT